MWAFEGMLIWTMLLKDTSSHLIGLCLLLQVPFSQSPCSNFASLSSALGSVHLCLLLKSPTRERKKERGRWGGRGNHLVSSRYSGLFSYKAFLEHPFKQPTSLSSSTPRPWRLEELFFFTCFLTVNSCSNAATPFTFPVAWSLASTREPYVQETIFVEWVNSFLFWITREIA